MNYDQHKIALEKLKNNKETYAFYTSSFDKNSVKKTLAQIKFMLERNPDSLIVLMR